MVVIKGLFMIRLAEELLTTVLKNGCLRHSRTVIRFSGSTTRHLRIKSLGSSKKCSNWVSAIVAGCVLALRLTRYVRPLRWHEAVFTLHNVTQHYHLLAVPERRAANEEGEHDDATRPAETIDNLSSALLSNIRPKFNSHVNFLWVSTGIFEHVAFERLWRQISRRTAQI